MKDDDSWILDYENHSTDETVKFIIKVSEETIFDNTYKDKDIIEGLFKLTSLKSTTNMHLYNKSGVIHKYGTIYQIMDEHYYTRLNMYSRRKEYVLNNISNELQILKAKMKFIQDVIDENIIVYKQSKNSIIDKLKELEYPLYGDGKIIEYNGELVITTQYNYLLNLSIYNFTSEKVDELINEINNKSEEYEELEKMSNKDIWRSELNIFREKYNEWLKKKSI